MNTATSFNPSIASWKTLFERTSVVYVDDIVATFSHKPSRRSVEAIVAYAAKEGVTLCYDAKALTELDVRDTKMQLDTTGKEVEPKKMMFLAPLLSREDEARLFGAYKEAKEALLHAIASSTYFVAQITAMREEVVQRRRQAKEMFGVFDETFREDEAWKRFIEERFAQQQRAAHDLNDVESAWKRIYLNGSEEEVTLARFQLAYARRRVRESIEALRPTAKLLKTLTEGFREDKKFKETTPEAAALEHRIDTLRERMAYIKNRIVMANMRLVASVARRHNENYTLTRSDIIQEGSVGLMHAVDRFDPALGHKFSTYATWWIRQAIMRAIGDAGRTIRVPSHVSENLFKIERVKRVYRMRNGEDPSVAYIAKETGLSEEKVHEVLRVPQEPVSGDVYVDDENETSLFDFVVDNESDPEHKVLEDDATVRFKILLGEVLSVREKEVLYLRFGLGKDEEEYTLEEIAQKLGITRERVRQIINAALRKLHHPKFMRAIKNASFVA